MRQLCVLLGDRSQSSLMGVQILKLKMVKACRRDYVRTDGGLLALIGAPIKPSGLESAEGSSRQRIGIRLTSHQEITKKAKVYTAYRNRIEWPKIS